MATLDEQRRAAAQRRAEKAAASGQASLAERNLALTRQDTAVKETETVKEATKTTLQQQQEAAAERRAAIAAEKGDTALAERNIALFDTETTAQPTELSPEVAETIKPAEAPKEEEVIEVPEVAKPEMTGQEVERQAFLDTLGDLSSAFTEQLTNFETESGQQVDTSNPQLQKQISEILEQDPEADLKTVFSNFTTSVAEASTIQSLQEQAIQGGISSENLQSARGAFMDGTLNRAEFENYLQRFADKAGEEQAKIDASAQFTESTGQVDYFDDAHSHPIVEEVTETPATEQWIASDFGTSMSNYTNSGLDLASATAADLAQYTLLSAFNTELTPEEEAYFTSLSEQAKSTLAGRLEENALVLDEIDKAIDGENFAAETYLGLSTKLLQQSSDIAIEEISAQEDFLTKQYEIEKAEDERKNARLEGYLKAKLNSMGALDSSAGLTLMAENLHMANLQMDQKQATYEFNRANLNTESRRIMLNYTGKVEEIIMTARDDKDNALASYETSVSEIEAERLATTQDKETRKLEALNTYSEFLQKQEEIERDELWKAAEFAYTQQQDAIDTSFKMSGMTGTIYTVNPETGALMDTGVATFDALKYQNDYQLSAATLQLNQNKFALQQEEAAFNVQQDRLQTLLDISTNPDLANLGDDQKFMIQSMLETNLGLTPGALGPSPAEWSANIEGYIAANEAAYGFYRVNLSSAVTTKIENFLNSGQEVSAYSQKYIGIDPFDVPGIQETISSLIEPYGGRITQEYGATGFAQTSGLYKNGSHPGVDYVTGDGVVKAVTSGTVVKVQPALQGSDGLTAYGGYVWVEDDNGLIWQYGHMPSDTNAYHVQEGQRVTTGAPLGLEGATGKVYSATGGSGAHVDLSIVGATPNSLVPIDQTSAYQDLMGPVFESFAQEWQPSSMLFGSNQASSPISGAYADALDAVSIGLTAADVSTLSESIERNLKEEDYPTVKSMLQNAALQTISSEEAKALRGNQLAVQRLSDIQSKLDQFEALGGDTNVFTGTEQSVQQALGLVGDAELAELATSIQFTIQQYRKAVSGAAFTESENEEYKEMFPSIGNTAELNSAKINALISTLQQGVDATYSSIIGPQAYDTIFRSSGLMEFDSGGQASEVVTSPLSQFFPELTQ